MSTKPKPLEEMQRPMRRVGDVVRQMLACPLCKVDPEVSAAYLRVVAYRANTIRIECRICGLRFSLTADALGRAIDAMGGASPFLANMIINASTPTAPGEMASASQ